MHRSRRNLRHRVAVVLIAVLSTGGEALAQERSVVEGRLIDFRLSPGVGAFYYPQKVEGGGFYVGGVGYDLTWYGAQLQLVGEVQAFLPANPRIQLGLAGAVFAGLAPTGMDPKGTVSVHAGGVAKGGFGGVSGSYWLERGTRLSLAVGYGGTGVGGYYGGTGIAASVAAAWPRPLGGSPAVLGGLGVRFTYMALSHSGDASTRGESGGYMTASVEWALDWAPTRAVEAAAPP